MAADKAKKRPEEAKTGQWEVFFEEYKPWVLGACISLVVIGGLFFLGKWYIGTKKAEAITNHMIVVNHISDMDDREQVEAAARTLKNLAEQGHDRMALLDLGSLNYRIGNWHEAEWAYRRYLSKTEAGDPLRAVALESLAYTLEAQGRIEEALKTFEKASKSTKKPGRNALFSLARLCEKLGRNEDARLYYKEFLRHYPKEDILGSLAEARLKELGG